MNEPAGAHSETSTQDLRKVPSTEPARRFRAGFEQDASTRLAGAQADLGAWRRLLAERGLATVSRWSALRISQEAQLSREVAQRYEAAFALGRAVERARPRKRPSVRDARCVQALLASEVRGAEREQFFALLLDGRHRLQHRVRVGLGTLTCSLVHPREVFAAAVREAAAALVVAHNHPSGDPSPSVEDLEVTRRLIAAGALLGIPLLDHVVLAAEGCVSLRERNPELGFASAPRA